MNISKEFILKKRVYIDDTDYGGIAYHSRYLVFMEHARTEWLASEGIIYSDMADKDHHIIVRHIELDYKRAAKLNKMLEITCQVAHVGRTSLSIKHVVRHADDPNYICCEGLIKLVCINSQFKPIAIPSYLKEKLS